MGFHLTNIEAALAIGLCKGCADGRVASCIAALYLTLLISN